MTDNDSNAQSDESTEKANQWTVADTVAKGYFSTQIEALRQRVVNGSQQTTVALIIPFVIIISVITYLFLTQEIITNNDTWILIFILSIVAVVFLVGIILSYFSNNQNTTIQAKTIQPTPEQPKAIAESTGKSPETPVETEGQDTPEQVQAGDNSDTQAVIASQDNTKEPPQVTEEPKKPPANKGIKMPAKGKLLNTKERSRLAEGLVASKLASDENKMKNLLYDIDYPDPDPSLEKLGKTESVFAASLIRDLNKPVYIDLLLSLCNQILDANNIPDEDLVNDIEVIRDNLIEQQNSN